jgi:regulator of protease activity HflC (stomatin/prohibitin superfamily)
MPTTMIVIGILVLLVAVVALSSIRTAKEYEMGVVFRLGRLIGLKGPGFCT